MKKDGSAQPRVLVAYATRHGATAGIAERIGEVLHRAGLVADVLPADESGDLAPYGAFILGSAVYTGEWLRKASDFLRALELDLNGRPLWLFSSGPTGKGDPLALTQGWRFPEGLEPLIERLAPRDIAVFYGGIDPGMLSLEERLAVQALGAPLGDYRDWVTIDAWASGIAGALCGSGAASGG